MVPVVVPYGATEIGRGKQGTVYRLASGRCMKIYENALDARLEYEAYRKAEGSAMIPKLYGAGERFLIMEYVEGETLEARIKRQGTITRSDTQQILSVIREMKRLRFKRVDIALFHIFADGRQPCKIIDLVHAYTKRCSTPRYLFKNLKKLGCLKKFLAHVKELDAGLYRNWRDYLVTRSGRYGNIRSMGQ